MSDLPIPGLGNPNDKSLKEYIVTVKNMCDIDSLYHDIENPSGTSFIPHREIHCCKRRPTSRNTHYMLSYQEAAQIMNDPRVQSVSLNPKDRGLVKGSDSFIQTTSFNKKTASDPLDINWGLLRSVLKENIPDWGVGSDIDKTNTVKSSLSGKNVDVVIMDDGCPQVLTLEYRQNPDGTGYSRMIEHNWLDFLSEQYDYNTSRLQEHGAHTTGTVAGNTQGWARNANIYNLSFYDDIDFVKEWHLNKPVNPLTGFKNPTVMNNSWGYRYPFWSFEGITGINYRGTMYYPSGLTFSAAQLRLFRLNPSTSLPLRNDPTDVDFVELMEAGIIVVASAGNSYAYIDRPGGPDYDNYIIISNTVAEYCHRGSSPGSAYGGSENTKVICVGAMGQHNESPGASIYNSTGIEVGDYKAEFSNYGPGVDVYAPGSAIQSIWASYEDLYDNSQATDPRCAQLGVSDTISNNFKKCPGTSMSGPQVAGILACLVERFPRWTQKDARRYINSVCPETLESTNGGVTDDKDAGFSFSPFSCKKVMLLKENRFKPTIDGPFNSLVFPSNDGNFSRPSVGILHPRKKRLITSRPTFQLSTNLNNINQSETAIITLQTSGLSDGTAVPYLITLKNISRSILFLENGRSGVYDPDEPVPGITLDTRPYHTTEIVTTGPLAGISQPLTLETIDTTGYTTRTVPDFGVNDDGYWEVVLPFPITFLSQTYDRVFIGTNLYITFGGGSIEYNQLSSYNPPLPKIMISARDSYGSKISYQTSGSAGTRIFRVVGEFIRNASQTGGPIKYQLTFHEDVPNKIIVTVLENSAWSTSELEFAFPVYQYVSIPPTGTLTVTNNQATIPITAIADNPAEINFRLGIYPTPDITITLNQ